MTTFKRLTPSYIPAIIRLWRESGLPVRTRGRDSPKALKAQMAESPKDFMGAFEKGRLVGVAIVTSDGRRGYVNRLAVHPEFQRKGIATELIKRSEAELRSRGIGIVTALIERGNVSSSALFSKAGYEIREDITYVRKELVKGI